MKKSTVINKDFIFDDTEIKPVASEDENTQRRFVIFGQDTGQKNFLIRVNEEKESFHLEKEIGGMTMFNYAGVTMMNRDWMIVCGGIQYNL